jgi:hypothetical protein
MVKEPSPAQAWSAVQNKETVRKSRGAKYFTGYVLELHV